MSQTLTLPTREKLIGTYWQFSTESGYIGTEKLQFCDNGTIMGVQGGNEVFWALEAGRVAVFDINNVNTANFYPYASVDGRMRLEAFHIPNNEVRLILIENGAIHRTYGRTKFDLANEIRDLGWEIGDHTYGLPSFIEKGMSKLVIGKYCSIAEGCRISFGDHRTDFATTYPFASLRHYWNAPEGVNDHRSKGDVVIGSDVWIGSDVFIGSGVTIGHGAVVGGRAVVTKSIPPYAIAVGSPAKVAKYRFDENAIASLLELAWWDLDDYTVEKLLPSMLSTDINEFIIALRDVRSRYQTK
ncbi:CatB-related O-acetyltransferase [Xaviernesmea rhizosphaerae]|uniref:CatB-related O-acetyltransferase n=1 Tax=Xaviernesmea rhizosphaerae TaxID=1672749 RepID=UPI000ADF091B|nr:CatB-related O-acetyltransferase [Xaviernesmea rhizosphaerae]